MKPLSKAVVAILIALVSNIIPITATYGDLDDIISVMLVVSPVTIFCTAYAIRQLKYL